MPKPPIHPEDEWRERLLDVLSEARFSHRGKADAAHAVRGIANRGTVAALVELALLGVDLPRLIHRALQAEELVQGWRAARGFTNEQTFAGNLDALLGPLPDRAEWQVLSSSGEIFESPSFRFAFADLWRDAAKNFERPGAQAASQVLAKVAAAFPHTGAARLDARARARHLDRRRDEETRRLARELRSIYRQRAISDRERERLSDEGFLAWDGRAFVHVDADLLLAITEDLHARGRGKRPFLKIAASLLGAKGNAFSSFVERTNKAGQRGTTSRLKGPGAPSPLRKEVNECRDRKARRPRATGPASPSPSRPPLSAARPSRSSRTPRKAGGANSPTEATVRPSSRLAASVCTTSPKRPNGSAATHRTPPRRRRKEPDD